MTDLRSQLEGTLGASYTLERELGGGGMSRVFLAEERALGRRVVVKILPSDVSAGVNVERFKREIQVSAKLQHPHIVPVLSTGEMDGVPWYTMPFVEGESLRHRLASVGALPITEAVAVLRDVAKALAYAHDHAVVHRDIKPDNILLSHGSATVADFGIAKAISAARDEHSSETLTQVGTSLGTPAYMAPEQAAADPAANHRADIYAFGCVAYEVLTGRPPFTGKTPQKLLAAQMGENPMPVAELRSDTPPALADLVMSCLEKEADARPQGAIDLVRVLESVTSGTGHAAMPAILVGGRPMLVRALAFYAIAMSIVVVIARAAVISIGLPDWVVPGAVVVMLLGLPVILFTGYVQRVAHRAVNKTPTFTPGGTRSAPLGNMATLAMKATPYVSWRRTALGGVYAVSAFVLLVGGFMVMRALGIGPAASLFAAGKLERNERLLVTDFGVNGGADSSLGTVVSEAIRTDLAQSTVLSIAPASFLRGALVRMRREPDARVDATIASEIALREGIKAFVDGDVTPVGNGFIISARLVSPQSGDELWSSRETAEGPTDVIPAVERLSRALRGKIGESLRDVHASPDLADVTTGSLDALRKYAEGARASDVLRDAPRAIALLKEAIAIDSGFAMAWRKLAVAYNVGAFPTALQDSASIRAFQLRDRLPEVERLNVVGIYYGWGPGRDRAKAIEAFEALSAISPSGYHNLAVQYADRRDYARAESLYRKNIERSPIQQSYYQMLWLIAAQGRLDEADSLVRAAPEVFPGAPATDRARAAIHYLRGELDSAIAINTALKRHSEAQARSLAASDLANLLVIRGQLASAERTRADRSANERSRGASAPALDDSLVSIELDIWFRDRKDRGVQRLDATLQRFPLGAGNEADRRYLYAGELYARAGRPDRARAILAQYEREVKDSALKRFQIPERQRVEAEIALAERRPFDALKLFRMSDTIADGPADICPSCIHAPIARAFDEAAMPDSAIMAFERFLGANVGFLGDGRSSHGTYLAGTYKRLGELYEQRGNAAKAIEYYNRFVALWKNADPELQSKVADVRRRLALLSDPERRR
ncbi:MAG TPA: protein kinase [Gemmatimonadaceae bacterium]